MFNRSVLLLCVAFVLFYAVLLGTAAGEDWPSEKDTPIIIDFPCGSHGKYAYNACQCDPGWYGSTCDTFVNELSFGQLYSSTSSDSKWDYWVFDANKIIEQEIVFEVKQQQTDSAGSGDCDTYILRNALPNFYVYDYRDTSIRPVATYSVKNPSGKYFVGVTGFLKCKYTIVVSSSVACANNCSGHGTCKDGACVCDKPWQGEYCNMNVSPIYLNKETQVETSVTWNYFQLELKQGVTYNLKIQAGLRGNETVQFGIYSRFGQLPTLEHFDGYEVSQTGKKIITTMHAESKGDLFLALNIFNGFGKSHTFFISVSSENTCTNMCSRHGMCLTGECVCDINYSGEYCNVYDLPIVPQKPHRGYVSLGNWNYYAFVSFSPHPVEIKISPILKSEKVVEYSIFLSNRSKPTYSAFDQQATLRTNDSGLFVLSNPGVSAWWIGIVSDGALEYDITLSYGSVNCHNNGVWDPYQGICKCTEGWTDPLCSTKIIEIKNKQSINSSFVKSGEQQLYKLTVFPSSTPVVTIYYHQLDCLLFCAPRMLVSIDKIPSITDNQAHVSGLLTSSYQVLTIRTGLVASNYPPDKPVDVFILVYSDYLSRFFSNSYTLSVWYPPL
ncbi:uncharacterized protein LOC126317121 [Schistocerca gregaria]|uniref:uncharacterized protein LOC126317121 n=1 Tax=Schistocerca gregaria TaxID=7010 RepID=UPI00211DF219|nr:uncharacterized protein LOC126317121 [Schistocerca gregaria]